MNKEISKLSSAIGILPPRLSSAVMNIPDIEKRNIGELRLRSGRPFSCTLFSKEYYLTSGGRLSNLPESCLTVSPEEIKAVFSNALDNSVHSYHREITRGYITIEGGCRVGFCGTAVLNNDRHGYVENVKDISSINIRIAREVIGCADELYKKAFSQGPSGLVIGGCPSSGKTTVLRDLCRLCANEYRVSLIDERNEISSTKNGVAANDIGNKCDVFCSYTKYDAIMTAVKVMTPQILICDEVGSDDDLRALRYAVNSGVKLIVTAHCSDYNELKKRPVVSKLIKDKCLDYAAILSGGTACGSLKCFYKL